MNRERSATFLGKDKSIINRQLTFANRGSNNRLSETGLNLLVLLLLLFQGLGGLQSLDLSLNGLASVPLGLLDELQGLR